MHVFGAAQDVFRVSAELAIWRGQRSRKSWRFAGISLLMDQSLFASGNTLLHVAAPERDKDALHT